MTQHAETSRARAAGWPRAAVAIALVLVVGVPAAYLMIRAATAPARIVDSLSRSMSEAMRPKVTVKEVVLSSIDNLHKENKLVVFSTDLSVDVTREEGSVSWGIYWGTNIARVVVNNARVQYVIDLGKMQASDFAYHEPEKVMAVTVPRPHVDTTMVAIDPGQIMTLDLRGGWARFDKQDTKERALAELRPRVIVEASKPQWQELAQGPGIEAVTKLLGPMAEALGREGVTVKVGYRQ
jgi:hypothetical protein